MSQLEELYYSSRSESNPEEISQMYHKVYNKLNKLVDKELAGEIDLMYMDCVCAEKLESFKEGFRLATALWKEC